MHMLQNNKFSFKWQMRNDLFVSGKAHTQFLTPTRPPDSSPCWSLIDREVWEKWPSETLLLMASPAKGPVVLAPGSDYRRTSRADRAAAKQQANLLQHWLDDDFPTVTQMLESRSASANYTLSYFECYTKRPLLGLSWDRGTNELEKPKENPFSLLPPVIKWS